MDSLLRELLDADIDMERIEQLHIQAGWPLQQVKEFFVSGSWICRADADISAGEKRETTIVVDEKSAEPDELADDP